MILESTHSIRFLVSIFESMKLKADRGGFKEFSSSANCSWTLLFYVIVSKNSVLFFFDTSILRFSVKDVLQLISWSFQDILAQPTP